MYPNVHFTIAKTPKQPRYASTDEQMKKMWDTYTMGYYSAIKRNYNLPFAKNLDGLGRYYV